MNESSITEQKPNKQPNRRARRSWKWPRRILGLLLIPVCSFVIYKLAIREAYRARGETQLAAVIADLDATDPDWTWERLNAARPRLPEGKNGAELIPRVAKLLHPDWENDLKSDEWKALMELRSNGICSKEIIRKVRADVARSSEALVLARTFKDYPFGHREIHLTPEVLTTLLPDTQHTRQVALLLNCDLILAIEDGNDQLAEDNLQALLNVSRSISDEPFLVSHLVRIAVRAITLRAAERLLARSTKPPSLAAFQAALAADAEEPLLLYGLRGERAGYNKLFENLDNGTTDIYKAMSSRTSDLLRRVETPGIGWWLYRGHLPADHAAYLNFMTGAIAHARLPIELQPHFLTEYPVPEYDEQRILTMLLLPAVEKIAHASWRSTAEARCAVVGIACERFRQMHNRWPDSLEEIPKEILAAVPLDPYNGKPLRYQKLDDGVLIHSVGQHLSTKFGNVGKRRPEMPEGIDFGFRLWNPDQRRLPPREEP